MSQYNWINKNWVRECKFGKVVRLLFGVLSLFLYFTGPHYLKSTPKVEKKNLVTDALDCNYDANAVVVRVQYFAIRTSSCSCSC